jgi:hypothetical protein
LGAVIMLLLTLQCIPSVALTGMLQSLGEGEVAP